MGSVDTDSLAQSLGQSNNWIIDNARGKPVGSIQYSVLTTSQFQAIAGLGWVLAAGQALLVTDQLRVLTGLTTVPDMRGTMQRAIIGVETITGALVPNANPSHNHAFAVGSQVQKLIHTKADYGSPSPGQQYTPSLFVAPTVTVVNSGDAEFVPKYAVGNIFMRIN